MKTTRLRCTSISNLLRDTDIIRKARWMNSDPVATWRVPYEKDGNWPSRLKKITEDVYNLSAVPQEYFKNFANKQLAMFVYDANRMEGTIPIRYHNGSTITKINSFLSDDPVEPTVIPWCSEGGRELDTDSSDRQLYQCSKAVRFLLIENRYSPLSVELIIEVHRLMMENSYQVEQKVKYDTEVGKLRSIEVFAGMYQFAPASVVTEATNKLMCMYEFERERNRHPIDLATLLFYELFRMGTVDCAGCFSPGVFCVTVILLSQVFHRDIKEDDNITFAQ